MIYELRGVGEIQEIIYYKSGLEIGLGNGGACAKVQTSYGKRKVSCRMELWLNKDKQSNMNTMIGSVERMKGREGAQGNKLQIVWRLRMEVRHGEVSTLWQRPRGEQGCTGDDDRENRRGRIGVGMDMTNATEPRRGGKPQYNYRKSQSPTSKENMNTAATILR